MLAIIGLILLTVAVVVGVVAVLSNYGGGQGPRRGLGRSRGETAVISEDGGDPG